MKALMSLLNAEARVQMDIPSPVMVLYRVEGFHIDGLTVLLVVVRGVVIVGDLDCDGAHVRARCVRLLHFRINLN